MQNKDFKQLVSNLKEVSKHNKKVTDKLLERLNIIAEALIDLIPESYTTNDNNLRKLDFKGYGFRRIGTPLSKWIHFCAIGESDGYMGQIDIKLLADDRADLGTGFYCHGNMNYWYEYMTKQQVLKLAKNMDKFIENMIAVIKADNNIVKDCEQALIKNKEIIKITNNQNELITLLGLGLHAKNGKSIIDCLTIGSSFYVIGNYIKAKLPANNDLIQELDNRVTNALNNVISHTLDDSTNIIPADLSIRQHVSKFTLSCLDRLISLVRQLLKKDMAYTIDKVFLNKIINMVQQIIDALPKLNLDFELEYTELKKQDLQNIVSDIKNKLEGLQERIK